MLEVIERERPERGPTEQRTKKGGVVENNSTFTVEFPLFIDHLRFNDWIDDSQHLSGIRLISLRGAALASIGLEKRNSSSSQESGVCPMFLYSRILRELLPWQLAVLNAACWPVNGEQALVHLGRRQDDLRDAFDALKNILKKQKEILQNALDHA